MYILPRIKKKSAERGSQPPSGRGGEQWSQRGRQWRHILKTEQPALFPGSDRRTATKDICLSSKLPGKHEENWARSRIWEIQPKFGFRGFKLELSSAQWKVRKIWILRESWVARKRWHMKPTVCAKHGREPDALGETWPSACRGQEREMLALKIKQLPPSLPARMLGVGKPRCKGAAPTTSDLRSWTSYLTEPQIPHLNYWNGVNDWG
jgi:hypothetical protein